MRGLSFEEVFALLAAVQLSSADLARLREWLAGIAHPAECIALIEGAAAGRPCPHCGCQGKRECGSTNTYPHRHPLRWVAHASMLPGVVIAMRLKFCNV
jgi:hypothetical protein